MCELFATMHIYPCPNCMAFSIKCFRDRKRAKKVKCGNC